MNGYDGWKTYDAEGERAAQEADDAAKEREWPPETDAEAEYSFDCYVCGLEYDYLNDLVDHMSGHFANAIRPKAAANG